MVSQFFSMLTDTPAIGPFREYQAKWQRFIKAWLDFSASSTKYAGAINQEMMHNWLGSLPSSFNQQSMSAFFSQDIIRSMQGELQKLDQSWDKVMRSEAYADKGADLLHKTMELKGAMEDLWTMGTQVVPVVTRQQMEGLASKVQKMQDRLEELEEQSREASGANA